MAATEQQTAVHYYRPNMTDGCHEFVSSREDMTTSEQEMTSGRDQLTGSEWLPSTQLHQQMPSDQQRQQQLLSNEPHAPLPELGSVTSDELQCGRQDVMLDGATLRHGFLDNLCPVCNDRVSGYHYGLQTCESCKGE